MASPVIKMVIITVGVLPACGLRRWKYFLHLTYIHNRYYYPLKNAPDKDVHQEELERAGMSAGAKSIPND